MSKSKTGAGRPRAVPAEILKLLGPPPLLSTEDKKFYYAMLAHFAESVHGSDLMTWLLLKDVADARVEIARYGRFKTARITKERNGTKASSLASFRAEKMELFKSNVEREKKKVIEANLTDRAKKLRLAGLDQALENAVANMEVEYAMMRDRPDSDLDYVREFRFWRDDFDHLDSILQQAERRFRAALDELDRYERGRFGLLPQELDEIEENVRTTADAGAPGSQARRSQQRRSNGSRINAARSPLAPYAPADSHLPRKKVGSGGDDT